MNDSQILVFQQVVSSGIFQKLCSLWEQSVTSCGEKAMFFTEETLSGGTGDKNRREHFRLLISPDFCVLLAGHLLGDESLYQISLTSDPQAIRDFVRQVNHPILLESLDAMQILSTSTLQQQFNLKLREILASEPSDLPVSQLVEKMLRQQVEQERLLHQVIVQIRQSLELPVILETALTDVQEFLQVDRLVIYQFSFGDESEHTSRHWGKITYEARASLMIPSLINLVAEDDCFAQLLYQEKYHQGVIVAIDDVETAYSSSFCFAEFLKRYQIRSKLIAPLLVEGQLWGLLIAHQCSQVRHWLEREKTFVGYLAEHLAIAISQAQFSAKLQWQKNNFEQRVIERTTALKETLLAVQAANKSKNDFLGNMSHELRTPLTCVIGLSGTLLHCFRENYSIPLEKQLHYLRTIQENGKKLLEIINDILEFSELEGGQAILNIQEFSLRNFCYQVVQDFAQDAKNKRINLAIEFQVEEEKDKFFADPERLKQILVHLLTNAIKFTPEKGRVILRTWRENGDVLFQIEDTGIGIYEHQLPLLFEKFQQLESSRQRIYSGAGLGLALTKQLVELHRGTIEVESVPGEGSLFTVWIPNQAHRPWKKPQNLAPSEQSYSNNKTIVLLAQDEETATFICELLTAANYQVIWLSDGFTGIKSIEIIEPFLMIIEQVNTVNIAQIIASIRKSRQKRLIKILLIRDAQHLTPWRSLFQDGIDDYLFKPLQPNLLLEKVESLRTRYQDQ